MSTRLHYMKYLGNRGAPLFSFNGIGSVRNMLPRCMGSFSCECRGGYILRTLHARTLYLTLRVRNGQGAGDLPTVRIVEPDTRNHERDQSRRMCRHSEKLHPSVIPLRTWTCSIV